MNKILILAALAAAGLSTQAAQAQEMGRVLSATPVTQQIAIPRQVCGNETVYNDGRATTGAGAVLGAIAGGAAGNAIGKGSGRAAATAVGVIGGALLGNNIEAGRPGYQNVQRCTTETYYDNRIVGYDVVYEYAGRKYSTRTQNDPGRWIALTVQPTGANPPPPDYSSYPSSYDDDGYARPGYVVSTPPTPAAYVTPPVSAVIEYNSYHGSPHRPPHHRDWR